MASTIGCGTIWPVSPLPPGAMPGDFLPECLKYVEVKRGGQVGKLPFIW
jgi:hypothetical protein